MAKIIDFMRAHGIQSSAEREDKKAILSVVVEPAVKRMVAAAWLNPDLFTIDRESERKFMRTPLSYQDEDGGFCSVYYDYVAEKSIYRCECRIIIDFDNDSVEYESGLYRLDGYRNGNKSWLWFNGKDWEEGPGEMFDVNEFMDN